LGRKNLETVKAAASPPHSKILARCWAFMIGLTLILPSWGAAMLRAYKKSPDYFAAVNTAWFASVVGNAETEPKEKI